MTYVTEQNADKSTFSMDLLNASGWRNQQLAARGNAFHVYRRLPHGTMMTRSWFNFTKICAKTLFFYIFVPSELLTSICFPSGETNWSQKFTITSYVCSHVSHQICIFTAFWNHTGNLGPYDLVRDRPTDERTISTATFNAALMEGRII